MTGKIKVLKTGYGFITPDDGGKDIFFHATSLQKGLEFNSLREGDLLQYDVENSPKGLNAVNVSLQSKNGASNV